jgi:NitT/TauT family transport system substrate-binding protein
MKTKHFFSIISVLIIIIIGTNVSSCSNGGNNEEPETITIGLPALEQNALIYIAKAQQLFTDNGLDVKITTYDTGMTAINGLIAGEVDMAGAAEFPFARQVMEKQPLNIFAVDDRFENDYLVGRKDHGIINPADLKGKKIGVIKGTVLEFFLGRFLELRGLSSKDVTIVDTLTTSQTIEAIISGEVDAAVAFQPYANSIQEQLGNNAVTWPVQNSQLAYSILVAKKDWLTGHNEAVKRFLECLSEAESYLLEYPDESMAIVQQELHYDSDYMSSVWHLHQFSLSLDFSLIIALNDEARWIVDNSITSESTIPNYKDFIYADGLKAIVPEAVDLAR